MAFERPAGAAADTKELEYIAALIQTTDNDKEGFLDASIDARDIKYHLMSRYGIKITKSQVRTVILAGLGGGDDEEDCLDICEIVSALIIPFFRKNVQRQGGSISLLTNKSTFVDDYEDNEESVGKGERLIDQMVPPDILLQAVLKNILVQATGSAEPQPLTKELIRTIFAAYDETALVNDDQLVSDMMAAAKGGQGDIVDDTEYGDILFNVEAFTRALASDVMLYDPAFEDRDTTNFVDAFGSGSGGDNDDDDNNIQESDNDDYYEDVQGNEYNQLEMSSGQKAKNEKNKKKKKSNKKINTKEIFSKIKQDATSGLDESAIGTTENDEPIKRVFTFSTLDLTVDNYRSRYHVVCNWFGFILFFLRYLSGIINDRTRISINCGDGFGCTIAKSTFTWTMIMLELIIVGLIYFMLVGSGNDVYRKSLIDVLIGVGGLVIFVVLPYVFKFKSDFVSTDVDDTGIPFVRISILVLFILVGSLTLIFQIGNVIRIFFSDEFIGNNKMLSRLIAGTNAKDERKFKQAAAFKVLRMLDNAYTLHQQDEKTTKNSFRSVEESTNDLALLNFTKISDKTEPVGGFLWAWKSFINGELKSKEGIWLHTRILVGLCAQLLLVFITISVTVTLYTWIDPLFEVFMAGEDSTCTALFDPANCFAPEANNATVGAIACVGVTLQGAGCYPYNPDPDQAYISRVDEICKLIPPNPVTNEKICDGAILYDNQYATAGNIFSKYDCDALLSGCVVYERSFDSDAPSTAACVLGVSNDYIPFKFEGEDCSSLPPIDVVLASKPSTPEELEEPFSSLTELIPKKWMIKLCVIVGIIVGALSGLLIVVNYIPSTVTTILKFRSGVLPSLRDPKFVNYRKSLESVTYILGLMIWGVFYSSITTILLFTSITFFLVWQATRPIVLRIIAIIIGIAVTLVFKTILVTVLGRINYAAFYRKRPWVGNVCGVALECWHLGITTGYMLARTVKLIVAASLYIGRIDKPFMADDVGIIGPVHLDNFPLVYRQDLLSADAHRHPYIERLGLLYLLKLRHGSKFASPAGSTWRLLFVFSLMPWLRKYRIADGADIGEAVLLQKLGSDRDKQDSELVKKLQRENNELREEKRGLQEENSILKNELAAWINREKSLARE